MKILCKIELYPLLAIKNEWLPKGVGRVSRNWWTYYADLLYGKKIDEVLPKYSLLGTHCGRRTFICNALSLGIPPQVVMKWTGHSDYSAMKPYIDIADEIKATAMEKFDLII